MSSKSNNDGWDISFDGNKLYFHIHGHKFRFPKSINKEVWFKVSISNNKEKHNLTLQIDNNIPLEISHYNIMLDKEKITKSKLSIKLDIKIKNNDKELLSSLNFTISDINLYNKHINLFLECKNFMTTVDKPLLWVKAII